jgi:L-ribulose-5-phosphate 3-epimerase
MPIITRRNFIDMSIGATAVLATSDLAAFAAKAGVKFKVGVTDWNLRQEGKIESIVLAKALGFDGVQVSIGKGTDKLPLFDPALQKIYLDESKRVGLPVESLCLEILHRNYLKSDPLGQRWVADSIQIARAMGVRVVLLPFFGKGALETMVEMDKVGDTLKEIAPAAEKEASSSASRTRTQPGTTCGSWIEPSPMPSSPTTTWVTRRRADSML